MAQLRAPDTGPPESDGPIPSSVAGALPHFDHVYVVVLENKAIGDIVGDPAAPYLNGLIKRAGLATAWTGVGSPSQPNYFALFAGETLNVQDDLNHDLQERTIADQLEEHGLTWRVFAQNVPLGCYTGATAQGGPDGPGTYARKHEPAISFRQISSDPARCANITDLSHFATGQANYNLIIPNLCNDMHDCPVATGDAFVASLIPRIIGAPHWGPNDLLIVTFDDAPNGEPVATIVVSDQVAPGFRSSVPYTHYSLMRTIEASWGLGCLGNACAASDMRLFFAPATAAESPSAQTLP